MLSLGTPTVVSTGTSVNDGTVSTTTGHLFTTTASPLILDSVGSVFIRKITPTNQIASFTDLAQFSTTGLNISTAASGGLSFNGSAFYLTGSWTPSIIYYPNSRTTPSITSTGSYVVSGKQCTVTFNIQFTYGSGSATFGFVGGLPFGAGGIGAGLITHGSIDGLANPFCLDWVIAGSSPLTVSPPSGSGWNGTTLAIGNYNGSGSYSQWAPQVVTSGTTQALVGGFTYMTA